MWDFFVCFEPLVSSNFWDKATQFEFCCGPSFSLSKWVIDGNNRTDMYRYEALRLHCQHSLTNFDDLQALPYVCLLIAMLFFIYAIIGMQVGQSIFQRIKIACLATHSLTECPFVFWTQWNNLLLENDFLEAGILGTVSIDQNWAFLFCPVLKGVPQFH